MKTTTANPLIDKSYQFAIDIIKLSKELETRKEYNFMNQIWRSGTSIGANAEEAMGAASKKDFLHRITISYKEARETHYWLRLLSDAAVLPKEIVLPLQAKCEELLKIITAIQKSTKANLKL